MEKQTINGIDVVQDGDITHFTVSEETKREDERNRQQAEYDDLSFWQKLGSWFKKHDVKPCVKVRDQADPCGDRKSDPDDIDAGSDGRKAVEIGIKGTF